MDLVEGSQASALMSACGDIDILVNNAGALPAGGLDVVDEAAWRVARDQKLFGDPERWQALLDGHHPPGEPAHIGDALAFLASDRSANTTGTIITIDGGAAARG